MNILGFEEILASEVRYQLFLRERPLGELFPRWRPHWTEPLGPRPALRVSEMAARLSAVEEARRANDETLTPEIDAQRDEEALVSWQAAWTRYDLLLAKSKALSFQRGDLEELSLIHI